MSPLDSSPAQMHHGPVSWTAPGQSYTQPAVEPAQTGGLERDKAGHSYLYGSGLLVGQD